MVFSCRSKIMKLLMNVIFAGHCFSTAAAGAEDRLTYRDVVINSPIAYMVKRVLLADGQAIATIEDVYVRDQELREVTVKGRIEDGVYVSETDKKSFVQYKNNELDGASIEYDPKGNIREERVYRNGMHVEPKKTYYENGVLARESEYNKTTRIDTIYAPDGQLLKIVTYTMEVSGDWKSRRYRYKLQDEKVLSTQ